jgi:hypothetical protein
MLNDLRNGFRMLLKNPGFAAAAVLTLALGIGANTAIFSPLDAVMFRMLPVEDPEQLVQLTRPLATGGTNTSFSYPDFEGYRDQNRVCSGMFAFFRLRDAATGRRRSGYGSSHSFCCHASHFEPTVRANAYGPVGDLDGSALASSDGCSCGLSASSSRDQSGPDGSAEV